MFTVSPETGDQNKTCTLHRNLLLLVNDIPVETSTPLVRSGSGKTQRNKRKQENQSTNQEETNENFDSDDDGPSGYWLRVPTPNPVSDRDTVEQERRESRTEPVNIADLPQLSPESPSEQLRHGSRSDLHSTEGEDVVNEDSGPDTERSLLTPPVAHAQTELRRSTRERRPKQFFTYTTLGEPTLHSHANTNSVTAYTVPNTAPTHTLTPPMSPVYIPYSYLIWCNQMSHTPYTRATYVVPTMFYC